MAHLPIGGYHGADELGRDDIGCAILKHAHRAVRCRRVLDGDIEPCLGIVAILQCGIVACKLALRHSLWGEGNLLCIAPYKEYGEQAE